MSVDRKATVENYLTHNLWEDCVTFFENEKISQNKNKNIC